MFPMENISVNVFDVIGGKRHQRRKWIYAFENVKVFVYVIAVSQYNQVYCGVCFIDSNTHIHTYAYDIYTMSYKRV